MYWLPSTVIESMNITKRYLCSNILVMLILIQNKKIITNNNKDYKENNLREDNNNNSNQDYLQWEDLFLNNNFLKMKTTKIKLIKTYTFNTKDLQIFLPLLMDNLL